ncbi:MAG: hypothetical protein IPK87_14615 [Planctomycetes bacterium]|nr:hypothetical protein [Planctomycetota bacterium]
MPDYTSIFEALGVFARAFRQIEDLADHDLEITQSGQTFRSLDRLRKQFIDVLNDSGAERDTLQVIALLNSAAETARGWALPLDAALDAWLSAALAPELDAQGASREELLHGLARAMLADAESVAPNDVSVGTPAPDAGNAGDAACYVSGSTVNAAESVIDDERIRTQRVAIECVRDNAHHRVPVGQEEFRIRPEIGRAVHTRVIPVTSGDFADARNAVLDGAFEAYDAGFTHWSVEAGGGVFSRDTGEKLFGTGSLKITGDGGTAGDLRQDLAGRSPAIESGRFFALGAWFYVASHTAGSVTVDLLVNGNASTLALTIDGSTPTAEWLHLGGFEYLPRASFPNKVVVRIRCSADFDGVVHVDGASLAPAAEVPHAGLRVALFQGALAPQAGAIADRYTVDTSSNDAGAFQTFARDRLGIALPSDGTPTIDDTLAE